MKRDLIHIGIIDETQFVDIFGTNKQKDKYIQDGKFTGSNKSTILNKANKFCKIIDLGNRNYNITEVYDIPKDKYLDRMKTSLYKYIIPLILNKLVEGHDENNKISFTYNKWARQIDMVNKNYYTVKHHKDKICDLFEFDENDVNDFISKADDMISMYINNALKYLEEAGIIIWRNDYIIATEELDKSIVDIEDNKITNITKSVKEHHATEEEMDYYRNCLELADNIMDIKRGNFNKRYFGKSAQDYKTIVDFELGKRNIKYIYKRYEVYYIHLDWCKNLLNEFELGNNKKAFIDKFNNEFQKMITDNANERHEKHIKNLVTKFSEEYLYTFFQLCDMTINNENNSRSIKEMVEQYKNNENVEEVTYEIK